MCIKKIVLNGSSPLRTINMVPLTGLEPVRYRYRGILSPLCLPIPPQRHILFSFVHPIKCLCDSCGARNFLSLGATKNFDRGAFCALPLSATGSGRHKTAYSTWAAYYIEFKHIEYVNLFCPFCQVFFYNKRLLKVNFFAFSSRF